MNITQNKLKRRVVIIEDEQDLRVTFTVLIKNSSEYNVINSYEKVEDALAKLKKDAPDIILMDIALPGMDGIQGVEAIKKIKPACEIVMVTVFEDSDLVFRAIKAGACGYITKGGSYTDLVNALEEISKGGAPMSGKIARMVIEDFHQSNNSILTKRETQVLQAIAVGKTFSQISEELFIARETVKSHIHNIYVKLQVSKKSEALAIARREKLL